MAFFNGNTGMFYNNSDCELILQDANSTVKCILLSYWTCFFVTSPTPKRAYPSLTEKDTFYQCKLNISYALETECEIGDSLIPCGFWICVAITGVILLFANFGIFSNILNLFILPKSLTGSSAKRLMLLLAVFDLIAVVFAIPVSLLMILILGRYEVHYAALESFRFSHLLFSLGRTGSIFTTITIAIERYIAIAYPLKHWLTPQKARIHLIILLVVVFFLNLPWWISKSVDNNPFYQSNLTLNDNSGLSATTTGNSTMWSDLNELPYIFKGTAFAKTIYPKIVSYHIFVDFALPFPVLLIFNGLLYRSVYQSNKARQTLTISERREVNAAKMFSIVVVILLLCHAVAVALFVETQLRQVQLRELQFLQVLATTLNAAINFCVYYLFGKSFRDEFWNLIHTCKVYKRQVNDSRARTPSVAARPGRISNGTIELNISSFKKASTKSHNCAVEQES